MSSVANRRCHLVYGSIVTLLIIALAYSWVTAHSRYSWVFKGITKADVIANMGQPPAVYGPDEQMIGYSVGHTPPKKGNQEVWVYSRLMKYIFVYFDENGKVQTVFITNT